VSPVSDDATTLAADVPFVVRIRAWPWLEVPDLLLGVRAGCSMESRAPSAGQACDGDPLWWSLLCLSVIKSR
jgi:hypothetical protein